MNTPTPTPSVSPSEDTTTATPTPAPTPAEPTPEPTATVTVQPVSNDNVVDALHDLSGAFTLFAILVLFVAGIVAVKHLW